MIKGIDRIIQSMQGKLGQMKEGDVKFTLPWMCVITKNGDVFLNSDAPLNNDLAGTSELKVIKTSEGYDLDFSNVERFDSFADSLEEKVSCIVGGKLDDWFKVGNITDEYKRQRLLQ